jgi:hypothetical protein
MESGPDLPGATGDVVHDVVLAHGEVIKGLGANASVQEGPLTMFFGSFDSAFFQARRAA